MYIQILSLFILFCLFFVKHSMNVSNSTKSIVKCPLAKFCFHN